MTTAHATVEKIAKQIGSTLLPDNKQWTNRFEVKSASSSRMYVIAQQRADGVWGCSCPGWTHHRKCKHLKDVLRRLTALAASMPTEALLISAKAALYILDNVPFVTPTQKGRELDLS